MELAGISSVTAAPAPMTTSSPIVIPARIVTFTPHQTRLPMEMGLPTGSSVTGACVAEFSFSPPADNTNSDRGVIPDAGEASDSGSFSKHKVAAIPYVGIKPHRDGFAVPHPHQSPVPYAPF